MEVDLFISKASDKQLLPESVERGIGYQDIQRARNTCQFRLSHILPQGQT